MNIVQPLKKTIMLLEKFNCIIMFKNKAYIGISFVILIFGIYAVPKIVARIKNDKVVQGERLDRVNPKTEVYTKLIKIGPAPKFELINQNNEKIEGRLEIAASTIPSQYLLPPILNDFRQSKALIVSRNAKANNTGHKRIYFQYYDALE